MAQRNAVRRTLNIERHQTGKTNHLLNTSLVLNQLHRAAAAARLNVALLRCRDAGRWEPPLVVWLLKLRPGRSCVCGHPNGPLQPVGSGTGTDSCPGDGGATGMPGCGGGDGCPCCTLST